MDWPKGRRSPAFITPDALGLHNIYSAFADITLPDVIDGELSLRGGNRYG
jgi:hypothetical protein